MYSLVLLPVCSFLIVCQLRLAEDLTAECSCIAMLASSIWNCPSQLVAERFLSAGFRLVLSPRSRMVLLLVASDMSLSMSSRPAPLSLYATISPRLVPDRDYFRTATICWLLVCCYRRISARSRWLSTRSCYLKSFHPASSLQVPYNVL